MTVDHGMEPRPALGVGTLFGGGFSLLGRHFGALLTLALMPAGLSAALDVWVYGTAAQDVFAVFEDPLAFEAAQRDVTPEAQFGVIFGQVVIWLLGAAMLSHAAWQGATTGRVVPDAAIRAAFGQIVPVLVCGFVTYLATAVGLVLLIVPGLWVAAFWYVIMPVLVAERTGPAAFGRASSLTEGYRWPLVGLILLYTVVNIAIAALGLAIHHFADAPEGVATILVVGVGAVTGGISIAFANAVCVLAYLRLREIKDGFSADRIGDVFG